MNAINTGSGALNPLERIKLIGELGRVKKSLDGIGSGPMEAMKRVKLIKQAFDIRDRLVGSSTSQGQGGAAPAPAATNPAIATLQEIADGKRDASVTDLNGLQALLLAIKGAVDQLESDGALSGAEAVAHAAIDRWADLEQEV